MRVRDLGTKLSDARANAAMARQIGRVEEYLGRAPSRPGVEPVVVFNASTRIHRLSLNAAFGLLAAWGLRLAGARVLHAVCERGMVQCPLGTNRQDLSQAPPCRHCVGFSRRVFQADSVAALGLASSGTQPNIPGLESASLADLLRWEGEGLALGELVLPTVRWVLRRHDLPDDDEVRMLFRQYLASAAGMARKLRALFELIRPQALVVFNGVMFPEAVARKVALERGIRAVTHEVGLRPFSAFFSHELATFRQVSPEADRALTAAEERRLDGYLEDRRQGRFSMAGIRFWPDMAPLSGDLETRLTANGRPVVVFTNVVFDTSQVHANTIYGSMFEWLEDVRAAIDRHPEHTYILRAHPDEDRPGKESQQSVAAWVRAHGLDRRPNIAFLSPADRVSSYDLVDRAGVVLVYNSSIGLEASIAGRPVLCAGRARYTEANVAFAPDSRSEYLRQLESLLTRPGSAPEEHAVNARRFLSFELFRASLDFSPFLQERAGFPGMVEWRDFDPEDLADCEPLNVVARGVLDGRPFHLADAAESGRPDRTL